MFDFSIDRNRCIQCGACIAACGRGVLAANKEGFPAAPAENEALCNMCGHCSAVCPVNAAISPGYKGERAAPFDSGAPADYASAKRLLLSCRSIRRFSDKEVPQSDIMDLLDIARRAPTAANHQGVRWLVLSGKEKARQFTALVMEWFDTVARDQPGIRYNVDNLVDRYKNGYDPILRGASCAAFAVTDQSLAWGPVDSAIAMTYFCLAAHAKNIGSCWCGYGVGAVAGYPPLRDFLKINAETKVQAIAFFGYPTIRYHAAPPRKPLSVSWI